MLFNRELERDVKISIKAAITWFTIFSFCSEYCLDKESYLELIYNKLTLQLFFVLFVESCYKKEGLTQLVECLAYNEKVSGSIPLFFIIKGFFEIKFFK